MMRATLSMLVALLLGATVLSAEDASSAYITPELATWLADNALPFATDDPDAALDDLAFVSDLVGDARIVSLGEATHGTAEFFRMKHRLLRYLVEEEDFRLFMIEADVAGTIAVNDYIVNGNGSALEGLSSMRFWTWRTSSVLAMIEWMREWNIANPDDLVYFYGFDPHFWPQAISLTLGYLHEVAPDYAASIDEDIYCFGSAGQEPDPSDSCAATIAAIQAHYAESEADYIAATSRFEYLLHHQVILSLEQLLGIYSAPATESYNTRDRFMADQVIAFAETLFPDERIVLWAHNMHVTSATFESENLVPMGANLRQHYGDAYLNIGFAFNEGTFTAVRYTESDGYGPRQTMTALPLRPNSHEAVFITAGLPRYMLDLRVDPALPAYDWLTDDRYFRAIGAVYDPTATIEMAAYRQALYGAYDVMIYFDETHASTVLP